MFLPEFSMKTGRQGSIVMASALIVSMKLKGKYGEKGDTQASLACRDAFSLNMTQSGTFGEEGYSCVLGCIQRGSWQLPWPVSNICLSNCDSRSNTVAWRLMLKAKKNINPIRPKGIIESVRMRWIVYALVVISLLIGLAGIVGCGEDEEEAKYEAVKAGTLVAAYEASEIVADREYKGEILEVEGFMTSYGGYGEIVYVILKEPMDRYGSDGVVCFFESEYESESAKAIGWFTAARAAGWEGCKLTIVGQCDGWDGEHAVLLEGCNRVAKT